MFVTKKDVKMLNYVLSFLCNQISKVFVLIICIQWAKYKNLLFTNSLRWGNLEVIKYLYVNVLLPQQRHRCLLSKDCWLSVGCGWKRSHPLNVRRPGGLLCNCSPFQHLPKSLHLTQRGSNDHYTAYTHQDTPCHVDIWELLSFCQILFQSSWRPSSTIGWWAPQPWQHSRLCSQSWHWESWSPKMNQWGPAHCATKTSFLHDLQFIFCMDVIFIFLHNNSKGIFDIVGAPTIIKIW